jgi:hypothetical protein
MLLLVFVPCTTVERTDLDLDLVPADGDGLDLLGYVEFQRNYRWASAVTSVAALLHPAKIAALHSTLCSHDA